MRKYLKYASLVLLVAVFNACEKDKNTPVGSPTLTVSLADEKSFFGDSLAFTVEVADQGVDLSTLKVQLLYSEDVVAEELIRTKTYGTYAGKIYIPFLANIPNGTASLKFTLQNVSLTTSTEVVPLPLERPDFPFLTLVTEEQSYRMDRKALYQYGMEANLPSKVKAYIVAPAYGKNGNVVNFGWEDGKITQGSTQVIPFSSLTAGSYALSFNSMSYAATPFEAYTVNGEDMQMLNDDQYTVDLSLDKEETLTILGIPGMDSWWLDSDYIVAENGAYKFQAAAGRYRITADLNKKYLIFEALNGNDLATLQSDGSGAIWIIGEGIGKPHLSSNEVGWTTEKALCMAPIGDKKYQITLVAGDNINANAINFKFFHQKNWGGEFKAEGLSSSSDIIFVGDGSNGRDSGNLGIVAGKQLEAGASYVLTIDLSAGNGKAVLAVQKK